MDATDMTTDLIERMGIASELSLWECPSAAGRPMMCQCTPAQYQALT
jgi:hypothetical protein